MTASVLCRTLLLVLALPAAAGTLDDARDAHRAGQLDAALILYADVAASDTAPADRAAALNNACVILTDRGDLTPAAKLCDQALTLRRASSDQRRIARTLNNVARVQDRLGYVDVARRHHREALAINTQLGDSQSQIISLTNLGVLETNAGHYAAAMDQYRQAEAILARVPDANWAPYQRVLLRLNQGVVLEQVGAYRDALNQLEEALAAAATAAPGLTSDIQMNRGVVLRNLGDPVAALAAYRAALVTFEERGDQAAIANVHLNQALVHWLDQGDLDTAVTRLDQARALSEESGDVGAAREARYFSLRAQLDRGDVAQATSLLAILDDATEDWFILDARARVAHARGASEQALDAALSAINYIESQRAALIKDTHRQTLLTDRRAAYALAIDILFERYQRTPTQDVARQALRIAGRAKALALLEATGHGGEVKISEASADQRSGHWLELFVATRETDVWTVRANNIVWRRYDTEPIQNAAQLLHSMLRGDQSLRHSVVDELLPIIADLDYTRADLAVAPDGSLALVPFDFLIAHRLGGNTSPLTVRYVATLGPAVSPPADNMPRLFAFAHGMVDPKATDHPALRMLQPLPDVTREVSNIAAYFDQHAQVLVDNAASETALRNAHVRRGDVLHIASHAVVDSRLDDAAVLILGRSDDDDGLLYPRDVAALNLPVTLTVLSACSTANGQGSAGAPVTNLVGAFMAAGSRAVMATLWPVDDAASAVVMDQFYAQLARGLSPIDALQATKRRLAESKDWSAPSVWAGYVIYGESGPIINPPNNTRWFALLALPLLGAFFVFGWWRRVR